MSDALGDDRVSAQRPLTLGTAGHIDHGKTALVGRLTGKNTDRLREERERGISIELGYAELVLPGGRRLSVVDVPGHERFVRTMVAGATGIDLFLLVVAADDGVMPQTTEHLAIIELLGIREGVVALTKADLVDDELLALAEADVREFLVGSPYESCDVVTVSAKDGRGIDELRAALAGAAARVQGGSRGGPARLPVDRVFPLKGIGTVVTGTLWRGSIASGDALVVQPAGARATVRSVQVHDRDAAAVHAGSRVGVNLRGIGHGEVVRGDWLVASDSAGQAVRRFDAWVAVLPGARPLRAGEQLRLHHGTGQYLARVAPLGGREIAAGSSGAAVVRLDAMACVEAHDRFIIRTLSPVMTIAGGQVLRPGAWRWRTRERQAACLAAARVGDARAAIAALAGDRGPAGLIATDLTSLGLDAEKVSGALAAATAAGELQALPDLAGARSTRRWFGAGILDALRASLLAGAAERAAARPQRPFSGTAELAALVPGLSVGDVGALLAGMAAGGGLVVGEGGYAPAGAGVLGAEQAILADGALERLRTAGPNPPTLATLADELRQPPRAVTQVLDVLARREDVVRLDKDLWVAGDAVAAARERLLALLNDAGQVTLAGFRDEVGCGRRTAQALLEYFDREGLTLRRGDVRVARRRR